MRCRVCGQDLEEFEIVPDIKADVNMFYSKPRTSKARESRYYYCEDCRLGQLEYQLDNTFYSTYNMADQTEKQAVARSNSTFQKEYYATAMKKLADYSNTKGKLLDIGCGAGDVTKIAAEYFEHAEGVEPSARQAEIAVAGGLDVKNAFFDEAWPRRNYSAFIMTQVLEHLENPLQTVQNVWNILEQGGVGYVDVPNGARIYNESRYYDVFLEHVNYWSVWGVVKVLYRRGL